MFCIFIIIDLSQYFAKHIDYKNATDNLKNRLGLEKKLNLQQLWLVDIPVLAGIIVVSFFLNKIDITMLFREESIYIFSVGSVAMQIIYSQIVFFILNVAFYYNMYKSSKAFGERKLPRPSEPTQ
jgi:formate hydrogenlyase subunit 3/multisubunit Na+/H+ antiporter MnhD subunit